ncbi:MAG: hypothetical protein WB500_04970 [Rhodoplanes sp.]
MRAGASGVAVKYRLVIFGYASATALQAHAPDQTFDSFDDIVAKLT